MKKLQDRVAVVTGSTSGIGKAVAELFAAESAAVVVSGRNTEAGNAVVAAIVAAGGRAVFQKCHLTQTADCVALIKRAIAEFGRIDILVNNAADTSRGTLETATVEQWDHIFATNARAPFILCQEAFRDMKPRRRGVIVNIGSVNAYCGGVTLLPYAASKGALMTFSRNIAAYAAPFGIRSNLINVGWTLTEGERRVMRLDTGGDEWLEDAKKRLPFGRLFEPEEVARAALFFACEDSSLITGAVLDAWWDPLGWIRNPALDGPKRHA